MSSAPDPAYGRRIAVVGCAGAGKTTLANKLSVKHGLAHIELDALFHGPNWTERRDEDFAASVRQAMVDADQGWAMCGAYDDRLGALRYATADTVIWLDYSRAVTTRRVVWRSLNRVVRRTELWAGNRESWRKLLNRDPAENIILWSWKLHPVRRARYERQMVDGTWNHLDVIRLRSPRETDALLATQ